MNLLTFSLTVILVLGLMVTNIHGQKYDKSDSDQDGIPDVKDNCAKTYNPDQTDSDFNGVGDSCDSAQYGDKQAKSGAQYEESDSDKDGVPDIKDNCPKTYNPDQTDSNGNGIGDACDSKSTKSVPKTTEKLGTEKSTKKDLGKSSTSNDQKISKLESKIKELEDKLSKLPTQPAQDGQNVVIEFGSQISPIPVDPLSTKQGPSVSPTPAPVLLSFGCGTQAATITGTARDDVIFGTTQNDVIVGLGGNDIIYGLSGSDIICGGDGADIIYGGDGDDNINGNGDIDTIYGGAGADNIVGEDGNDSLYGEDGNDGIGGGNGNDVTYGGDGSDSIRSGEGNDIADGGSGDDLVYGEGGNDSLNTGSGSDPYTQFSPRSIVDDAEMRRFNSNYFNQVRDIADGGPGNDILQAGPGRQKLFGGDGDDALFGNSDGIGFSNVNPIADYLDGGSGTDRLKDLSLYHSFHNGEDCIALDWAYVSQGGRRSLAFLAPLNFICRQ